MLELRGIKKTYHVGDIETKALDGVDICFGEKEFVAILGTSGSGKTTALNIIGGLDHADEGELIIKGKGTAKFTAVDWDAYRNNSIGFVFQSYNLIGHLSIVANVELGMTLSGVPSGEKRRRALEVLNQVGLSEHLHKKPTQLSGGQMQRVAIARALANNPEILLCDEPTGALDTTTSGQIMDLIKSLSKERLVIMVTHNPEIAAEYADRIIRFKDGRVIDDSKPYDPKSTQPGFNLKKTAMSYITALRLSANNIRTKLGRTFLTAFASSIGIIGIALILSLSNGFKIQIDKYQTDAISEFPVIISQSVTEVNEEEMQKNMEERRKAAMGTESADEDSGAVNPEEVVVYDPSAYTKEHVNKFTDEFLTYLDNVDPEYCRSVGYTRLVNMNLVREDGGTYTPITLSAMGSMTGAMSGGNASSMMSSMANAGLSSYPDSVAGDDDYLRHNYDLLSGEYPDKATDIVMVVDSKNRVTKQALEALGFAVEGGDTIPYEEILGMKLKLIDNNDYYYKTAPQIEETETPQLPDMPELTDEQLSQLQQGAKAAMASGQLPDGFAEQLQPLIAAGTFTDIQTAIMALASLPEVGEAVAAAAQPKEIYLNSQEFGHQFNSADSLDVRICGVVRQKEGVSLAILSSGLAYSDELSQLVIDRAKKSDIVKAQENADYSVATLQLLTIPAGTPIPAQAKDMALTILGGTAAPYMIMLYPTDFAGKADMLNYIDDYNLDKPLDDHIIYTDLAGSLTELTKGIMDGITYVLVAFASVSLVVSLIMISIITYISVLERTKEIGILRALGARKKDITRVFDAETLIIGLASGLLGVIIAWLLTFPTNIIIYNLTDLKNVAQLDIFHALLLVVISTALTVLGGHIPARMASKRDAVEALRSE